jgi:hypothetical protein
MRQENPNIPVNLGISQLGALKKGQAVNLQDHDPSTLKYGKLDAWCRSRRERAVRCSSVPFPRLVRRAIASLWRYEQDGAA